jgi:hypothetical protein
MKFEETVYIFKFRDSQQINTLLLKSNLKEEGGSK